MLDNAWQLWVHSMPNTWGLGACFLFFFSRRASRAAASSSAKRDGACRCRGYGIPADGGVIWPRRRLGPDCAPPEEDAPPADVARCFPLPLGRPFGLGTNGESSTTEKSLIPPSEAEWYSETDSSSAEESAIRASAACLQRLRSATVPASRRGTSEKP